MPSTLQDHLRSVLPSEERAQLRDSVLPVLLNSVSAVAKTLQAAHTVALAGSANAFGDDQLNVDVLAEEAIRTAIRQCPAIVTASSEEEPVEKAAGGGESGPAGGEQYTIGFDPLDGSSIIASNWTVGTIIGIWDGHSAIGPQPRTALVASILGVLGPRATAIVALRTPGGTPTCFEVAIAADGVATVIRPDVRFTPPPFKTRYFAPANLRAAAQDKRYLSLVNGYIDQKYTLRYSGGLVPDIVHALVKGHGIYISPVTSESKAKLRRLYELCPVALIIECAGGKAIDPTSGKDILNSPLGNTDERAGLVCGTAEEVDAVKAALFS
ncbi:sedoheptulose-1,7-bisphosphatase [Thozetella sp. PMI_491]|nr:sedoheptulose-1,7-bisphosphatase [Thozetella sp. PMI_491]